MKTQKDSTNKTIFIISLIFVLLIFGIGILVHELKTKETISKVNSTITPTFHPAEVNISLGKGIRLIAQKKSNIVDSCKFNPAQWICWCLDENNNLSTYCVQAMYWASVKK